MLPIFVTRTKISIAYFIKYYNRFKNFQITQTVVLKMIRKLTQCAVHEAGHYRRRIGGVAVCWRRHSSRRLYVSLGQLITVYWQRNCSACAELGKVNNNWRLHNTASRGRSRCPTHPLAEISPPPLNTQFWLNVVNNLRNGAKGVRIILHFISNGPLECGVNIQTRN